MKMEISAQFSLFIEKNIIYNQSALVDALIRKAYEDSDLECAGYVLSRMKNYQPVNENGEVDENNGEYPKIYEWHLVSDWMADKLDENGECVLRTDFGTYWGRQCTGQSIALDSVMETIYNNIAI